LFPSLLQGAHFFFPGRHDSHAGRMGYFPEYPCFVLSLTLPPFKLFGFRWVSWPIFGFSSLPPFGFFLLFFHSPFPVPFFRFLAVRTCFAFLLAVCSSIDPGAPSISGPFIFVFLSLTGPGARRSLSSNLFPSRSHQRYLLVSPPHRCWKVFPPPPPSVSFRTGLSECCLFFWSSSLWSCRESVTPFFFFCSGLTLFKEVKLSENTRL